jgi:hypothetical protein
MFVDVIGLINSLHGPPDTAVAALPAPQSQTISTAAAIRSVRLDFMINALASKLTPRFLPPHQVATAQTTVARDSIRLDRPPDRAYGPNGRVKGKYALKTRTGPTDKVPHSDHWRIDATD